MTKAVDFKTIQNVLGTITSISEQTAKTLVAASEIKIIQKSSLIETSGQRIKFQYVVMSGIVRKFLTNTKGKEFTTDFFTSGQAITPALLRSVDYIAFVNLEVISPQATIMQFYNQEMEKTMQGNKDLEQFGFKIMMLDAYKSAEREKILLTASGVEKLDWFRKNYSNLENEIPHYYIASFLGLTPTSLSRLRKMKK